MGKGSQSLARHKRKSSKLLERQTRTKIKVCCFFPPSGLV
jgi:hypothetical protein